jgi:virulence factor
MKIAIFGAGGIADKAYLPLLTNWPGVEITGIYSRTAEAAIKAANRWHINNPTNDFDQLMSTHPTAAFVITNNATHFPFSMKLMHAGVDVFVEKPFAITSQETREMADTADASQRILMVGFNRRFALLYQQARELFGKRKIDMTLFEKHRNTISLSHTNLYDYCLDDTIHHIDLIRYFCGEVTPYSTKTKKINGKMVSAVSLLNTKDGGLVVLLTSLQAGSWQERVALHGENYTIEVEAFQKLKVKSTDHEEVYGTDRAGKWINNLKERGFYGSVEHFFECVNSRQNLLQTAGMHKKLMN